MRWFLVLTVFLLPSVCEAGDDVIRNRERVNRYRVSRGLLEKSQADAISERMRSSYESRKESGESRRKPRKSSSVRGGVFTPPAMGASGSRRSGAYMPIQRPVYVGPPVIRFYFW